MLVRLVKETAVTILSMTMITKISPITTSAGSTPSSSLSACGEIVGRTHRTEMLGGFNPSLIATHSPPSRHGSVVGMAHGFGLHTLFVDDVGDTTSISLGKHSRTAAHIRSVDVVPATDINSFV